MGGSPALFEGTGDASLAVDVARGSDPLMERPRNEPGEEEMYSPKRRGDEGSPLKDMGDSCRSNEKMRTIVRTSKGVRYVQEEDTTSVELPRPIRDAASRGMTKKRKDACISGRSMKMKRKPQREGLDVTGSSA
jgi:hypothetical protein